MSEEHKCPECDFVAKSERGLGAHQRFKHVEDEVETIDAPTEEVKEEVVGG